MSTATVRGSSIASAPSSGTLMVQEDPSSVVTPTPSKDPSKKTVPADTSSTATATALNLGTAVNNATNKFLQKYPVLAQWKSRRAFVTAQYQMLGILAIAYVVNNWPVSYLREANHNTTMFGVMLAAMMAGAYYTAHHDKEHRRVQLLSRAQTEEWKGWMQFIFIMYHYYRNRAIYNEIRVLVSAYVWMTGFGNFLYFDKKQDFSLERMVSMWVRINYFPLLLSIFLNVKLELYYVVPLHTVGFFMTMATCYGAKLLREKQQKYKLDQFRSNMIAIGISLLLHVVFFETSLSGLLSWISPEYEFRFQTDKYSAWFGVFCGFLWNRFQSYMQWCYGEDGEATASSSSSSDTSGGGTASGGDSEDQLVQQKLQQDSQGKSKKPLNPKKQQAMYIQRAVGATLLLTWYFVFGNEKDKHVYNPEHPFIFWMPLAGWLMLRNSSKYLTELHSTVLEFMGRITLETYVLQFHVFMCQNVQHIPVVIPGSGVNGFAILKLANMLITGAGFVTLAWYARQATIVTQDAIKELVSDLKKKVKWCGASSSSSSSSSSSGGGREDSLMNTKPTLGIIDEPDDAMPLLTPQKDKKDEEP